MEMQAIEIPGIIINSQDVADLVMTRMTWDENESQLHIMNHDDAPTSMGRPTDGLDQQHRPIMDLQSRLL